jgi:hypothetical protein
VRSSPGDAERQDVRPPAGLAARDSRLATQAATIAEETMIAFQITINGQKYCESEDISVFTMVAEEIQRREAFRISLHAGGPDSPLQWLTANLRIGDEIAIRVVDTSEFEPSAPPTCSFCAREVHEVSTLVQGTDAAICDGCVRSLSNAIRNGIELPVGASIRDEPGWTCGLCQNQPGNIAGVVVRNGAAVCPECLRSCAEIIEERPRKNLPDMDWEAVAAACATPE